MSVFFTDSNSELWHTVVEELGAKYISMPFTLADHDGGYDLGKTFDFDDFYKKIRQGVKPTTYALNPQNYIDIFEPFLAKGEDILYVHFSSKMSGTFQFMEQAISILKDKYPARTIKFVDTKNISLGAGLIAYEACKLHNSGATDDEVINFVTKFREEIGVYFTVDDLMHLKRGGRLSATSAIFGTLLQIKPILSVNAEGALQPIEKVQGRKKALLRILELFQQQGENVADYPISIIHADAKDDAEFISDKIREIVGPDAIIWHQPIGPTVGTHCGPGTIGIVFHKKAK